MADKLRNHFSSVFEPVLLNEINQEGNHVRYSGGETMMNYGNYIKSIPLLLKGSIKVMRTNNEGKEILLYFIHPGETCAMTLSCCLGHTKSEIKAVAETDLEMIAIPIQKMEEWSSKYKSWRNFVFQSYHHQLMDAFTAIDIIAFSKLDQRLLLYLKNIQKVKQSYTIKITHQDIATDLNSSRVVISRLLKKLEQENKIKLKHNHIIIKNLVI